MTLHDLFKQISGSLWRHKVRTFLALFGIVWGTVTVLLLLAISNGFYAVQIKNLAFLNNANIAASPGTTSLPYKGMPQGQKIHIQLKDLLQLIQTIPGIKAFSPVMMSDGQIQYKNKEMKTVLQAVAPDFFEIQTLEVMEGGRFISPLDIDARKNVVYLDHSITETLFGLEDPIGKSVIINRIPFRVIGVTDPKHTSAIKWFDNSIFIPFTTYVALTGKNEVRFFFVKPTHKEDVARIKQDLMQLLAAEYHFDPLDDEAIHMPDLESSQMFMTWFFRIIEFFLGFCGALTLSVGGLGVANMMFLIVTERTREIGLRMALGAEEFQIKLQFLCETLCIVALGGCIGFLISGGMLALFSALPLPTWLGTPAVSWGTFGITLVILSMVGMIAGYFPAQRAARMEPVKALAF